MTPGSEPAEGPTLVDVTDLPRPSLLDLAKLAEAIARPANAVDVWAIGRNAAVITIDHVTVTGGCGGHTTHILDQDALRRLLWCLRDILRGDTPTVPAYDRLSELVAQVGKAMDTEHVG